MNRSNPAGLASGSGRQRPSTRASHHYRYTRRFSRNVFARRCTTNHPLPARQQFAR
ncbi:MULTISPECIES: hypothetical protein [Erwinia]|uniref:Uncharacterized protein n=2 Tax=Erwinia TaxID=551 RepID=A0ABV4E7Z7_9GAMM